MNFITIILIGLFAIFGFLTSYIDLKTKKVIVLFDYLYLFLSTTLIITSLVFYNSRINVFTGLKNLFFTTLIYAITISLSFFLLNIGSGDAEFLWVISPTLLFFANFNVYKLVSIYLGQLWFACIGAIFFKIILKTYHLLSNKPDINRKEVAFEKNNKFAFVPYLYIGTVLSLLTNVIL